MFSPSADRGDLIWAEMQKCRTKNCCLNDADLAAMITAKKIDGVGDVTATEINAKANTFWFGSRDAAGRRDYRATGVDERWRPQKSV